MPAIGLLLEALVYLAVYWTVSRHAKVRKSHHGEQEGGSGTAIAG